MSTSFLDPATLAAFRPDRMAKADLARGARLFLGLNCFEAGQTQAATVLAYIRELAEAGDDGAHSVAEAFASEE